ncbi:hypothetical protein QBC40DRAFT_271932 [Triangularia verruculosa]|uniref:Uncharacterized protein n=1 Tax=Triangularia verruculosa TaxID=2587418 RepID=A0AAN6XQS2_9PEZI|nr:hypothetical protein QBC40DRAFT_271932 [Triangularia verruculosa]
MLSPAVQAGSMLAKRAVSSLATAPSFTASFDINDEPQQPPIKWAPYGGLQLFVNLVLVLPVLLYIGYTLTHIYPTLAIVEDPLPEYASIPIDEPAANDPTDPTINKPTPPNPFTSSNNNAGNSSSQTSDAVPIRTKPITSSLRATHRTLSSISGFRSHFRGLGCFCFLVFVTSLLSGIFSFLPIIGNLVVFLLTSQLQTGLTHIIISAPRPQPQGTFFSRLPPWRRNIIATYQPILFYWVSVHAAVFLPLLLSKLIGLSPLDSSGQLKDGITGVEIAQLICVLGVFLGLNFLLVVPAHVALVRVQATLLPHEDETIVPFDRTFGGSVEPEVISGKGFGNLKNALRTVSWASWVRLYLQQVKIMGVMMVLYAVIVGVLGFEYFFLGWRN